MNNRLTCSALMFAMAILPLTAFPQTKPKEVIYTAEIVRVIDGDTVVVKADWIPKPLKKEIAVRIYGVDTPEKNPRAKCEAEHAKAQVASGFTKKTIELSTKHQLVLMDWDKYGGRVLGDILLDGASLRKILIQQGHAREYYGATKKSWC